jgi:hypothetical protein
MFVLGERRIRPRKAQKEAKQYLPEIDMGHSEGSSAKRSTPILDGVIGRDDNVFDVPARIYREQCKGRLPAVPALRGLRFNDIAHKLLRE